MSGHQHRPTTKKENKAFKSRKATKSELKDSAKGRTQAQSARKSAKKSHRQTTAQENKAARRNKNKQIQQAKRHTLVAAGRTRTGDLAHVPRVVAVIDLCDEPASVNDLLGSLLPDVAIQQQGPVYIAHLTHPRNATLQVLCPTHGDLLANLDACTAADYVLLRFSSTVEVPHWGENLLRCLTSQGLPENGVRAFVPSLPEDHSNSVHASIKKSLLSYSQHFFPSVNKVFSLDSRSDASNMVRSLTEGLPKGPTWREERARLLIEEVAWDDAGQAAMQGSEQGTLKLTGYVRGANLSADKLLHLPNLGDFQIARIVEAPTARKGKSKAGAMDTDDQELLEEPTSDADDLVSTNVPDDEELLQNEQTWPTEEELAEAAHQKPMDGDMPPPAMPGTTPKYIKKVPKGTSAYQAAWIVDSDEDGESASDDDDDDDMSSTGGIVEDDEAMSDRDMDAGDDQATEPRSTVVSFAPDATHTDLDAEEEEEGYRHFRAQRQRAAQDDADFPDEMDTPQDRTARERFARFRGMKSFRTSPWDAYEDLPQEYARLFMFENWKSMARKMVKNAQLEGVEPGARVTVYLKDVPKSAGADLQRDNHVFTAFQLHKHEHKYSVVHFTVLRNTEFEEDVRSKDPAILMLGPRRFLVNPLFSQHSQSNGGKGINNVHKFMRFLRPSNNGTTIATAYLPITFGSNIPALLIQPSTEELIGSGSLLSCDPTRILAKRVILTGHPYKLHKRTATIRYLFFNSDDVHYFKPVQLKTKKGRTGYIHESLGTHGYFKAGFDGPIDQMDTVCLNLYKRCFPKWGTLLREEPSDALADGQSKVEEVQAGDVEME